MKTNVLFTVVVSLSVIINVSCNTAPHEPPLPPIVDNCSFNNSQLVTDTPWIPLSPPVIMPQHHYYEGYEILDVAFNPNDPNKIALALYVYDSGVINEITTNGSAIVVYDLCNEQSSTGLATKKRTAG